MRRELPQLDPDAMLHRRVIQVDLEPMADQDCDAGQGDDVLHGASNSSIIQEVPDRGRAPALADDGASRLPAAGRAVRGRRDGLAADVYRAQIADGGDVLQRVAVDSQDVGVESRSDASLAVAEPARLGTTGRQRLQDLGWAEASRGHIF